MERTVVGPDDNFWLEQAVGMFLDADPTARCPQFASIVGVMAEMKTGHVDRFFERIMEICKTMENAKSITCAVAAAAVVNPTRMGNWLNRVMNDLILGREAQTHHVLGGVLGLFETGASLPRPEYNPYLYEPIYESWMKENVQRIVDTSAGGCYKAFPHLRTGDFRKGSQDKVYKTFKSDLGGAVSRCLAAVDGGRREMVFAIVSTYVEKDNRLRRWVCPVAFLVMRQLSTSCFNNLIVGEPERVLALYAKSLDPLPAA